ncbi:MAG: hypothetical protein ACI906_004869 [Candidatus Latescibacterota bacterium]
MPFADVFPVSNRTNKFGPGGIFSPQWVFLMENPLGAETVSTVDVEQRDVEKRWEEATFPQAFNRSACQFLMLGELLLKEVERPDFLAMARQLLDCEEVHIGACGKNHSD